MTDQLPKKLNICPIVDSVVEIRFSTNLVAAAVFGILYESFKINFPKVEELPILQFPQAMREADPNLRFTPHYRLTGDKFLIQIGPRSITVSPTPGTYPGWQSFSVMVTEAFETLFNRVKIENVIRLGIRYTNFFGTKNIYEKLNLKIKYHSQSIPFEKTLLKTDLASDDFTTTLQVSNDATRNDGVSLIPGSIIDVDTFKIYPSNSMDVKAVLKDVENGHTTEKRIFWDLLNDSFKTELGPTY